MMQLILVLCALWIENNNNNNICRKIWVGMDNLLFDKLTKEHCGKVETIGFYLANDLHHHHHHLSLVWNYAKSIIVTQTSERVKETGECYVWKLLVVGRVEWDIFSNIKMLTWSFQRLQICFSLILYRLVGFIWLVVSIKSKRGFFQYIETSFQLFVLIQSCLFNWHLKYQIEFLCRDFIASY